jgi:hypothetical protein
VVIAMKRSGWKIDIAFKTAVAIAMIASLLGCGEGHKVTRGKRMVRIDPIGYMYLDSADSAGTIARS